MAVLMNTLWRPAPGRTADLIEVARGAKSILDRLGGKSFLVQWSNAGSLSGTLGFGLLYPDLVAWGRSMDAVGGDSEWLEFFDTHMGSNPNPAGTVVSQTIASDQPGFEAPDPAAPGTFVLAVGTQLAPGRNPADVERLVAGAKPAWIELGAQWVRFRRVGFGGEATLSYSTTLGFSSAAAYAEWQMKWAADPRGQAFSSTAYGAGSPLTGFQHATGRVLPL